MIAPALWTLAILAAFVVNWAAFDAYDHVISPRIEDSDPDPVEDLKRDYEKGRITLDESEDRVELHLDDRAQETRQRLERIDGIGPDTSATIARQYRTLDELRDATRDDLEAIHGVGPATSNSIKCGL